jgi:thiol-disulfide isomerase/thioredoxin
MRLKRPKLSNIIFLVFIILMIIPQTRQPIQIYLHKGLAMFSPSEISENERKILTNYSWKLKSLNGLDYDFKQAEDKVILINFWATWCPPCIAEMPVLQSLYNDYGDKIEFLLVSQEAETVIRKFLDKHDYTFEIHRSISEIPLMLQTKSIPRTLIISKEGNIVVDKIGVANWNSESVRETLDKLLAE